MIYSKNGILTGINKYAVKKYLKFYLLTSPLLLRAFFWFLFISSFKFWFLLLDLHAFLIASPIIMPVPNPKKVPLTNPNPKNIIIPYIVRSKV